MRRGLEELASIRAVPQVCQLSAVMGGNGRARRLRLTAGTSTSSLRLQLALLDEADHEQRDNRNGCDGLRH